MFSKIAYYVWKEENKAGVIITLCGDSVDAIGRSIHIESITEFFGAPSSGKTQVG